MVVQPVLIINFINTNGEKKRTIFLDIMNSAVCCLYNDIPVMTSVVYFNKLSGAFKPLSKAIVNDQNTTQLFSPSPFSSKPNEDVK